LAAFTLILILTAAAATAAGDCCCSSGHIQQQWLNLQQSSPGQGRHPHIHNRRLQLQRWWRRLQV